MGFACLLGWTNWPVWMFYVLCSIGGYGLAAETFIFKNTQPTNITIEGEIDNISFSYSC